MGFKAEAVVWRVLEREEKGSGRRVSFRSEGGMRACGGEQVEGWLTVDLVGVWWLHAL